LTAALFAATISLDFADPKMPASFFGPLNPAAADMPLAGFAASAGFDFGFGASLKPSSLYASPSESDCTFAFAFAEVSEVGFFTPNAAAASSALGGRAPAGGAGLEEEEKAAAAALLLAELLAGGLLNSSNGSS
jgi:hypothetical protein